MATNHKLNLWRHQDELHQQTGRTLETEVPKSILGRARTVAISYPGPFVQILAFIVNDLIQGSDSYNAYEKDIAVVNIFFGASTVFGDEIALLFSFLFLQNLRGVQG